MFRPFLALRYLLTRPINMMGVLGITVGVWSLIVVVSIFSGFLKVVSEHVRSAGADLTVIQVSEHVSEELLRKAVLQDPNVAACAAHLVHFGLLHKPGQQPGPLPLLGRGSLQGGEGPFLFVLGVDPAQEVTTSGFAGWLAAADANLRVADLQHPLQERDGRPAVLLGQERMVRDGLRPGDRVVLTTGKVQRLRNLQGSTPERIAKEFTVAGAYRTQHTGFDGNYMLVDLHVLRSLLYPDLPEVVHELAVKVKDDAPAVLAATAERLQEMIPQQLHLAPGTMKPRVETWMHRNRAILLGVDHQRGLLKIVLIVILVVAAFLMFATLSMMVTEKTSDIGILTALGGTPGSVMQVFLLCGLCITVAGLVLGTAVGCLSAVYLMRAWFDVDLFPTRVYNLDRVPHDLDPLWIAQVCGMALGVGAVVSALPAFRAARADPLASLRGT
jgi:lipoprotein-releasing system permease protein